MDVRSIDTGSIRLRAAIEGQGPLVVLVHGFPESWYSWRHQLGPLAEAGFTACAIDVRGYGGSDKPAAVEDYDMASMTGDVAGVIAALSPDKPATVVGHDWGAPIVWHTAMRHPDRVRAVAALSVPYTGPSSRPLIDIVREAYTDKGKFYYMVYFQDEGTAEAELDADIHRTLRTLYSVNDGTTRMAWSHGKQHGDALMSNLTDPGVPPRWLSAADLEHYAAEFRQSGFRGPLNRYRNFHRDFAATASRTDHTVHQPALFIAGEHDPVLASLRPSWPQDMHRMVPDLRGSHILPGIGHWTQQEAPDAVNRLLVDWLARL